MLSKIIASPKLLLSFHFFKSLQKYKEDVLYSQFHQKGILHFRRNKQSEKLGSQIIMRIEKLQTLLDIKRKDYIQQLDSIICPKEKQKLLMSQKDHSYLKTYVSFIEEIQNIPINDDWLYRIIGWYNVRPFLYKLVDRLLDSHGKSQQFQLLVNSIDWMNFNSVKNRNQITLYEDKSTFDKKFETFYKNISLHTPFEILFKLQRILGRNYNAYKVRFFSLHMKKNTESTLRSIRIDNQTSVTQLISIFRLYISNLSDDPVFISKIQKLLILAKFTDKQIEELIEIYNFKGNIPSVLYLKTVKPYLVKQIKSAQRLIYNLQFVILSECNDNEYLATLIKQISLLPLSNKQFEALHIYQHYLKIRKNPILFPSFLKKVAYNCPNINCSSGESKISNLVYFNNQSKKQKIAVHECLKHQKKGESRVLWKQIPQQFLIQLNFLKIDNTSYQYIQNQKFCEYQLQHVLNVNNELINIQKQADQYFFTSGRMTRKMELRDQILNYYGFKIIHLDRFMSFRKSLLHETDNYILNRIK